jgi:hypothetical protein
VFSWYAIVRQIATKNVNCFQIFEHLRTLQNKHDNSRYTKYVQEWRKERKQGFCLNCKKKGLYKNEWWLRPPTCISVQCWYLIFTYQFIYLTYFLSFMIYFLNTDTVILVFLLISKYYHPSSKHSKSNPV